MIGRKIPREKPYSKENGRLVEFNETQMDEWRELGSHINRFFKVESDLPVTKIRIEWANGYGVEMHQEQSDCSCSTCESESDD